MALKTRTISTIAAAAIALTAGISTVAGQQAAPGQRREELTGEAGRQPGLRPGGHRGPGRPLLALRGLNLSDDQRAQIKAVMDEARTDRAEAPGRKLIELNRSLRAALFAETPDPAQIDQLRAAIAEAEAAALAKRIEVATKISQILTPEQSNGCGRTSH